MARAWLSTRSDSHGFSLVELLLAVMLFGFLSMSVSGALVYGRASTVRAGDRVRASYLAEEGAEAVRNIRGNNLANLTDGTYGLAQSGGVWTLSGTSDTSGIYTRAVTIAPGGTNRKTITSQVTWDAVQGTGSVDVVSELTNWQASFLKSWKLASQYGGTALPGNIPGYKVATSGQYAYVVRDNNHSPNFFVVNINDPLNPAVVGSATVTGVPSNIAVSGNYAYVTSNIDTAELQIFNVTTPTAPVPVGTFNATGNGDGEGVTVVGTTAYLTRSANATIDEFVIVNVANPASPSRVGGIGQNVNMFESYISGTTAYVSTSSNIGEVMVINLLVPALPVISLSLDLPGSVDATSITGYGTTIAVAQASVLSIVSASSPLLPTISGSLTLTGQIQDLDDEPTRNYIFAGTDGKNEEFQVIDINTPSSPKLFSVVNMAGGLTLNGVAYNSLRDVVVGATSNTAQGVAIFGPN